MSEEEGETIRVGPDSDLAKAMRKVSSAGKSVVIDPGEDRYSVYVADDKAPLPGSDSDLSVGYDHDAALTAFRRAAGSWSDVDADEMIANIYRWRKEGSRPADRP